MKKLLVGVLFALLLTTTAFAGDVAVNTNGKGPVQVESVASPSTSLFNAGEVGLSLSSGYVLDKAAPFKKAYSLNTSAGVFWFPFRNFGVEANLPFYSTAGVSVQEVQFGVLARLPLSSTVPVLRNVATYVGIGSVYNWQTASKWAYVGKAGVDFRLNKKWGIFAEDQYRNDSTTWGKGQNTIQGGLKLVF